jgi:hypothetical protein
MKSFTDKQAKVALVFIFVLFCWMSNDDFNTLQKVAPAVVSK